MSAQGCCLAGHPDYYGKFRFQNMPELVMEGVPPEVFFALSFDRHYPQGAVMFYEGFKADSQSECIADTLIFKGYGEMKYCSFIVSVWNWVTTILLLAVMFNTGWIVKSTTDVRKNIIVTFPINVVSSKSAATSIEFLVAVEQAYTRYGFEGLKNQVKKKSRSTF